jgi:hypothetical protein
MTGRRTARALPGHGRVRALIAAAGLLATLVITAAAAATPVSASVSAAARPAAVMAFSGGGCKGDVCLIHAPGGDTPDGTTFFYAANDKAFKGHFRFLGPDHVKTISPTRTWPAHGLYHFFPAYWTTTVLYPRKGYYCLTGWRTDGAEVGRVCVHSTS